MNAPFLSILGYYKLYGNRIVKPFLKEKRDFVFCTKNPRRPKSTGMISRSNADILLCASRIQAKPYATWYSFLCSSGS